MLFGTKRRHWTTKEKEKTVRMYDSGKTCEEIAEAVGRSVSAVRRFLSAAKAERKKGEKKNEAD